MGDLTVYRDIIQGTEEWHELRRGIVTASVVGKLLTPTLKVASNDTSRTLTLSLMAERITGNADPEYFGWDMMRGVEDEPRARDLYAQHHSPVEECGFMVRTIDGHRIGYSPDGLVGDVGLIEVKSRLQKHQLRTILDDRVPDEYVAQIQCGLLVSGRRWCDFVSHCGGMPLFVKRVTPDLMWQASITAAVAALEASIALSTSLYRDLVRGLPLAERAPDLSEIAI